MAFWADFYKYFTYAFKPDSLSRKRAEKTIDGVGVTQPDAIPDIRADNWWGGGNRGQVRLRDSNDFIDLSSVTNRQSRYKEYERLRFVAEIEAALDILADESCVSGDTPVITPFGNIPIKKLAETKKPGEKYLVYCYDFEKEDFTLGWGHDARKVKTAPTVKIFLNNGVTLNLTEDHKVLLANGTWIQAGEIKEDDELMPFYRVRVEHGLHTGRSSQFPRIYTFKDGWKHERQFVDEWRMGDKANYDPRLRVVLKCLSEGLMLEQAKQIVGGAKKIDWKTIETILRRNGFTYREVKMLNSRYPNRRTVLGTAKGETIDVYDISVDDHENFATDGCILHNCQLGDNGHTFEISCKNETVKKELEYMYHKLIKVDRKIWNWAKNLYCMGDWFGEVVIDPENPKLGVLKINPLPADSIYRIETTKGKLLEFQQSKEGPDYQSLAKVDITQATDSELAQATAIRFAPEQIIHIRIGDDRKTYYPYGVSIIEPARGPANQLRLMEDAMVVYRLCLVGNSRVRTPDGWKYIKDMNVGDKSYTFSYDGEIVESNIVWTVNNGIKPVFKVKSKHIEVTGTATHPILVLRDGLVQYVDIQDIKPKKDKFINVTQDVEINTSIPRIVSEPFAKLNKSFEQEFNQFSNQEKNELRIGLPTNGDQIRLFFKGKGKLPLEIANQLCDRYKVDTSNLQICHSYENDPSRINLPAIIDEEFARWFGFMLGDGGIRYTETNSTQLYFIAGDDKELNEKYSKLMEKYFGKVTFEKEKRNTKEHLGKYVTSSKCACEIMKSLGFIGNKYTKRIPKWAYTAPKHIRRALIEGISDADGCERYTKAGTWFSTIELCNQKLTEDIKEVWHSIGLCSGKLGKRNRKGGHEIEPGRKMKDTVAFNVTISNCVLPKYENIWSVTPVGEEEVYDVTVDRDEHNIIVNGTILHQTRAPERRVFYIDVGGMPPNKAEAFIERLKDQLRKKKMYTNRASQSGGAGSVEERWHAPSADEDFWLPIRPNGNTRIETLPGACIALDTKIPLLDGRTLTLQEIIKEFDEGKQLWAYSCNPENGSPAPGMITWAGVTRKNTQVLKIHLDNGKTITCTPDHKFPVIGKGKVHAKDLQIGESLIPFNTRKHPLRSNRKDEYTQIYDVNTCKWIFVHRLVAEYLRNTRHIKEMTFNEENAGKKKGVVHHVDFDKFNNNPSNLAWMEWDDHMEFHASLPKLNGDKISAGLKRFHKNLTECEKEIIYSRLKTIGLNGSRTTTSKLKNDLEFRDHFVNRQLEGWENRKKDKTLTENLSKSRTERNNKFWSNPENKKKVFGKQTVVYPDSIFNKFMELIGTGLLLEEALKIINKDLNLINDFVCENKHIVRTGTRFEDGLTLDHSKKMVKSRGFKGVREARKFALEKSGIEPEKNTHGRQKGSGLQYPKPLMDVFMKYLSQDISVKEAITKINEDTKLLSKFFEANVDVGYKTTLKTFAISHALKMVKAFGYEGLSQAREEAHLYNHKVVKIEYLDELMDTGTLTIDGNEELHNYHNFCSEDVCLNNSNLGEVDDALYFRNKLLTALHLPKNYLSQDDPNVSKTTLSSQDVKFARYIERLQSSLADGLLEIAERHLTLRGFPQEMWDDLEIRMTPPSEWRELSRMEVMQARYSNASTVTQGQPVPLMSRYDALIDILKYPPEVAREMSSRAKMQGIEDQKITLIGQSPELSGLGQPGDDSQEMGGEAGGPNPMLGDEQNKPPEGETPPPPPDAGGAPNTGGLEGGPAGAKEKPEAKPLPEPEKDDIKKYDLEIKNWSLEKDEEEIFPNELGEL